VSVSNVEFA